MNTTGGLVFHHAAGRSRMKTVAEVAGERQTKVMLKSQKDLMPTHDAEVRSVRRDVEVHVFETEMSGPQQ